MPTKFKNARNFVARNERKILVTALVVTTTAAVVMRAGISQHNEFLRAHGLYDAFYDLALEEV